MLRLFSLVFFVISSFSVYGNVIEEVKRISDNHDRISLVLFINQIKKGRISQEEFAFLEAVWAGRPNGFVDLPSELFDDVEIRVELAHFLAQSHLNNHHSTNLDVLHDFLRDNVNSNNIMVRIKSTVSLGLFDYETDIPLLLQIALKEDPVTFKSSIHSIFSMCNTKVDAAIEQLKNQLKKHTNKQYLEMKVEKRQKDIFVQSGCWANIKR